MAYNWPQGLIKLNVAYPCFMRNDCKDLNKIRCLDAKNLATVICFSFLNPLPVFSERVSALNFQHY